ncbi:MAG: site-2 protease family protein [Bryobacteraceae bacterium]
MAQTDAPRLSGTIGAMKLFGVPVRLHFTFLLLFVFLIFFSVENEQSGASSVLYIAALFASVLLHELGHAVVARRYGIRTLEIVMFPIGGLARLERSPKAREELWIALAGPAVNLFIAGAMFAYFAVRGTPVPLDILMKGTDANLLQRIAAGNLVLALFNLLPAFPMDGGRVLRSLLALSRSEDQATQMAARAGRWLSVAMGLYGLLSHEYMLIFIAFFVYVGASQEGMAAAGRSLIQGITVAQAMMTDFRTLSHGDTLREAANLLLATSQHDFPVLLGERVVGILGRNAMLRALASEGPDSFVASAMDRDPPTFAPSTDLSEALPVLTSAASGALVMEDERLIGLLTTENLSELLLLRRIGLDRSTASAAGIKG